MMSKEQNIAVQPKIALDDLLTRCTDYDDMSLSMDAGELKALKQHISLLESSASTELLSLREQLEAERQRANTLQTERDEFRRRLKLERSILEDTDKQLAELKALEPFGYIDAVHNWNYINLKSELNKVAFISKTPDELVRPDYGMPLFTAAKPAED